MSEPQKTVEETQPQATASETPAENHDNTAAAENPADASKEAPAESTDAHPAPAAESSEAPAEQPKEDQKETKEVTFASEGVLGYKAPGLVKSLRFSKRFVYFNDEPVPNKQLNIFHQNEKPAVANPIAAWASQTGKGLLFLTKRSEDKATPGGIINLADVGDIIKEGNEFHFKVDGHKHTFQAANIGERDSWIATLKAKSATAKEEKESITTSEGYKAELQKLTHPYEAIAKKAAENKDAKKEEGKTEEGKEEEGKKEEPKKEESAPAVEQKDQKSTSKSRSQSRKRTSIFGSLLGKKDDAEKKEEEKKEQKKEDKPEEAKPAEGPAETPADAPAADAAAEAAPTAESDKKEEQKDDKKEESKEEKAETPATQKSKRSSVFGNFFQKVTSPSHEKSEKEASAPAETSVASTAPQLDNPIEEAAVKPIEPESVTSPTNGETAKDGAAADTSAAAKDKRRSSFFGFGKKKGDSDNEGTDGETKKNKLGGIFRKPSKAVKADKETSAEAESKPEPVPKDENKEDKPAESKPEETAQAPETNAAEESKPANMPSTSTTVEAAA